MRVRPCSKALQLLEQEQLLSGYLGSATTSRGEIPQPISVSPSHAPTTPRAAHLACPSTGTVLSRNPEHTSAL